MSVPNAILILYFLASSIVRSVPVNTCCNRSILAGAIGGANGHHR